MLKADSIPHAARFEEFDLADRMRRTLRISGIGVQEIAEALDVERSTVSTWINGRIAPRKTTLMAWALRTGAPYEWLATGVMPRDGDEPNRPPRD